MAYQRISARLDSLLEEAAGKHHKRASRGAWNEYLLTSESTASR